MPTLSFSIIIPTYRRPQRLAECLRALAALDYPRERFDVLVMDDAGGMPLGEVIDPLRERLSVTLLTVPHGGPAAARNAGIVAARGEMLAFTDDDCLPAPGWLRALAARHAECPGCLIGGHTLNALSANPYSSASQMLLDAVYAHYNADPDRARFFASNNLAAPAEELRALGGFDAVHFAFASEDRDLCARWLESGRGMVYAPEALIHHAHRLNLRSFWRQHLAYGRGAWRFQQALARRGAASPGMQPVSFYLHLLRYPFTQAAPFAATRLAALVVLSQVASTLGFALERRA